MGVHEALLSQGLIEHPYRGTAEHDLEEVEAATWWYRARFPGEEGTRTTLRFDCLEHLRYRLRRAQDLCGIDLDDPDVHAGASDPASPRSRYCARMSEPLRVGLVGAGPWAELTTAPLLAGGPETVLVGVWARRLEAAQSLADQYGAAALTDYEALLDVCDAVAFAVPPEVQGRMALQAARSGKHVLLDKPVADSLAAARELAAAVDEEGVSSVVLLSLSFSAAVRQFAASLERVELAGADYENISSAFLAGPFSQSPWRHNGGVVPDVGPHVVDLMMTLLGPVVDARVESAHGLSRLSLTHRDGAFSHAILGAHHTGPGAHRLRAYGPATVQDCDWGVPDEDRWGRVRREFAQAVTTGTAHSSDVHRGLELQRVLALALT